MIMADDINYGYQLEVEKKRLEQKYYQIGQLMLSFLNSGNNFGFIVRKVKHYLEKEGITAAITDFWNVSYIEEKDCPGYVKIIIHNGNDRFFIGDEAFYFCFVPKNAREYEFTESIDKYKDLCAKAKANQGIGNQNYVAAIRECKAYVTLVKDQLVKARESHSFETFGEIVESITKEMPYGDDRINDSFIRNKGKHLTLTGLISYDFEEILDKYVDSRSYEKEDVVKFKNAVRLLVRSCYELEITGSLRRHLVNKLNKDGIDELIKDVKIISTQSLGDYDYISSIIKDGLSVNYQRVIENAFYGENNFKVLNKKIRVLLKALHDLNNIDEQNSEYLTQFLLEYHITKGEMVDKVIKERPESLGSFWGHWDQSEKQKHKTAIERDRSCTFKIVKMVYVRKAMYTSTPNEYGKYERIESNVTYGEELLKKMRAIAQIFNEKSDIAYINSIEPGDDGKESFIFDFVTFKDEKDINGTRLSEFTRMFNQMFDPEKLYLSYSKDDLNSEELK
jgi:hypothetical protein